MFNPNKETSKTVLAWIARYNEIKRMEALSAFQSVYYKKTDKTIMVTKITKEKK